MTTLGQAKTGYHWPHEQREAIDELAQVAAEALAKGVPQWKVNSVIWEAMRKQ